MQKIQSYLYPNRQIILADLAGFTVENTVVYAKTVKIYQGVDNVLQFDIQNADQKRLDLTTLTNLQMNVFDQSGKALTTSPYALNILANATTTNTAALVAPFPVGPVSSTTITVPTGGIIGSFVISQQLLGTPLVGTVLISKVTQDIDANTTTLTVTFPSQTVPTASGMIIRGVLNGIGKAVIPAADLASLEYQNLKYSITATNALGENIPLYTDSRFSAVGTLELVTSAVPTVRKTKVYDRFSGEINYLGNVTNHTSAIPCKFYEATPTTSLTFMVTTINFIGKIYVEGTKDSTISVESFSKAVEIQAHTYNTATTTTLIFSDVLVEDYNYLRVSWTYPDVWQYGSQQNPLLPFGTVDTVTVYYDDINC
jgi:hypothetical protein